MFTTIEPAVRTPHPHLLQQAGWALMGWLGLLVGVTALAEPTRDAVIIGPVHRSLAALNGSDTRIMNVGTASVLVRGREPGYVRALYANGALLVLPSRAGGCLGLRGPT